MLVRVAITRAGLVGVLLAASVGCGRVVPYLTNEFGETGDGDGDGETWPGDGDGDEEPPGETWGMEPDLPGDPLCSLPEGIPCPSPDQKCVPNESLVAYECVPIYGPQMAGEACMQVPGENIDNCDGDSYCFEGVCRSFCDEQASCAGEGFCHGGFWLCFDPCDPLAQDCAEPGFGCIYNNWVDLFSCAPVMGMGEDGESCPGFGDPFNECAPGNLCIPEELTAPCGFNGACCSMLCDINDDDACADAAGAMCTEIGLFEYPNLGACMGQVQVEVGSVMFVEILADAPGIPINESPYEYIEIQNVSDEELDLGDLTLHDFVGSKPPPISEGFSVDGGSGGCVDSPSPTCLAPGRRGLFVGSGYQGETGEALVLRASGPHILGTLMQPWTRIELLDGNNIQVTTFRDWEDPSMEPLPVDEQPMHRLDPVGPDVPSNWTSAPPTPGQ